uniref:Uncharacterized protein n=1 Tax=Prevotella sp. GTC17254 TaxID=3236794 RepID=A0AB33J1P4_9BACT
MSTLRIYLFYKTDAWLSTDSRELVYIGEDFVDACTQLVTHKRITEEDVKQLMNFRQTQCNNRGWEWIVDEQRVNAFAE